MITESPASEGAESGAEGSGEPHWPAIRPVVQPEAKHPAKAGADRLGEAQGTIGDGGKRIWIYPRETRGIFTRYRRYVAWFFMAVYLGLPWLRWHGEPLLRLDWYGRKVVVLTHAFWVQDLPLFLPAILACILTAILVTARLGRIWCGWACPQTVFLQFLFAPIERFFEGKASRRKERDAGPITFDWLWRKTGKQAVFAAVSFYIANTALAYFWGTGNLLYAMGHPSSENWPGLALVIVFASVFYYIFAYFREQACVLICPYARFQSVLVDESTSVIAYDAGRGEPRGRSARGSREGLGDCTECRQCVLVCPTGIDIRDGQQLECIGCARCIDACDGIMAAWKKPAGLIRYASLRELQGKHGSGTPWRLIAYGALALILASVSGILLLKRPTVAMDISRRGASPYTHAPGDSVTNHFKVHLRNNGSERLIVRLDWEGAAPGRFNWDGRSFALSSGQSQDIPLDITVPASIFNRGSAETRLVLTGRGAREVLPIRLAGPWGRKGETP